MNRLLWLGLVLSLFSMLYAQAEEWHVYVPGGNANDILWYESELWVASDAGILRYNPQTGERTQYNKNNTPHPGYGTKCISFDSEGKLWAGSYYGVLCFDGEEWELFNSDNSPLPSNDILKVAADPVSGVWFETSIGLTRYQNGVWLNYNSTNSGYIPTNPNCDISFDNNGALWIGTYNGILSFNGNIWTVYNSSISPLLNTSISSIAFDEMGVGWFTTNNGVLRYADGAWESITSLDGNSLGYVKGCYVDQWERLWIWSNSALFYRSGTGWQYYLRSLFGDYSFEFQSLAVDDDMNLWIGMDDTYSPTSLVHFDGTNYSRYPIAELPIASRFVQDIFRGFDDKLWISTSDYDGIGGYFSIADDAYEAFGMYNTEMTCDHVWALAQDRLMNMWVSTCLGLLKIGSTQTETYSSTDTGVGNNNANTICAVGDGVWLGTSNGVSRYENGTWTPLTSAEAGMSVSGTKMIKTDTEGRIWIACSAGVLCYDQGQFTAYPEVPNAHDFAFGISGEVWVARGELSLLQGGTWMHFNAGNSGLDTSLAKTLALDQNQVLWIGTGFPECKLYRFDGANWSCFTSDNSPLEGLSIPAIYVDEDNTKWIGSRFLTLYNEEGFPVSNDEQYTPPIGQARLYPNPFASTLNVSFQKSSAGAVGLQIYNLRGQKVWEKDTAHLPKGECKITWDGRDNSGFKCAPGIYLIRMQESGIRHTYKVLKF